MDLRELVRMSPDNAVGHRPVTERLNVKKEFRRFSADPLRHYLTAVGDKDAALFCGDIGRYTQAFSWYALCLGRTLDHCSLARRFDRELRWQPATLKYSVRQAQIARRAKPIGPYQELDYRNLIIYTCILLDRAIALSRRFLRGRNLPRFTSFAQHKTFLKKHSSALDMTFRDYADRVASTTDWFDIPLKVLRDKYLMHSAERHIAFLGWSTEKQWDLEMITIIRASHDQEYLLERVKAICFSPRRLARDVDTFLSWFSEYGRATAA